MVNIWIPICGVKEKTGLPLAIGSHLIPENKILRSKAGVKMDGTSYNVNCIKSWDKSSQLQTIVPKKTRCLFFLHI